MESEKGAEIQLHEIIMHEPNDKTRLFGSSYCSGFFQVFHGLEYFFDMAGNFQAAPFLLERAVWADQEGAALNAFDLFALHDLVFNTTTHVAHFFFCVGNQLKLQFQFGFEIVM